MARPGDEDGDDMEGMGYGHISSYGVRVGRDGRKTRYKQSVVPTDCSKERLKQARAVIIDGRNRLRACELAGVEPQFEARIGDPATFIVSANLNRRNLSKGQQAMALAMIYPEPEKGGRGKKREAGNGSVSEPFSKVRLSEARAVLRHSRSYAEQVLDGSMSLDEALAEVRKAQGAVSSVRAEIEGKVNAARAEAESSVQP